MVKVLRRADTKLHPAASQIIFQVGPDAVDDIVALLKKEEAPGVRLACLQTLAMVGPPREGRRRRTDQGARRSRPACPYQRRPRPGQHRPRRQGRRRRPGQGEKDGDANVRQIANAALAQIRADPKGNGFQIQGVLTAGDPFDRVRGGCYHVVHTYQMKAGQQYTINLNSPWDNYLRLENAQGQELAQDDDSGGNLNARIIFNAPKDGWYRIIVTSFAGGASGNYTLTVR